MIWDRHRHVLRLRVALREYFPAALAAFDDLTDSDTLELLAAAPDPDRAARLSRSRIAGALKREHRPAGAAREAGQAEVGLLDSLAAAGVNLSCGRRHRADLPGGSWLVPSVLGWSVAGPTDGVTGLSQGQFRSMRRPLLMSYVPSASPSMARAARLIARAGT